SFGDGSAAPRPPIAHMRHAFSTVVVCVLLACGPTVEIASPLASSAASGAGGSGGEITLPPGGSMGAAGSASAQGTATSTTGESSSSSGQDCTPTCTDVGGSGCDCKRPCGDFEMHPERVYCGLDATGSKMECTCVIETVIAGVCYETTGPLCVFEL